MMLRLKDAASRPSPAPSTDDYSSDTSTASVCACGSDGGNDGVSSVNLPAHQPARETTSISAGMAAYRHEKT